jgi:hypothetical protein
MVTGKDWEDQRFDWPGFHPKDPLPFPGLGEIGPFLARLRGTRAGGDHAVEAR